jgi:mannosyltransferase
MKFSKFTGNGVAIGTIILIAFILRLIAIDQSLWHDEAITALAVRDYSYSSLITLFAKVDNHPPLYYLLLKAWSSVFGYSELALRIPSVIFGIATVYVFYKVVQLTELFKDVKFSFLGFGGAELAALLLVTSSIHIYYSQEARMYSLVSMLVSISIYLLLRTYKSNNLRYWIMFSLSLFVTAMTNYASIFMFPAYWIISLLKGKNLSWWKKFLLSHLPIALFGILWTPTFLNQISDDAATFVQSPRIRELMGGATLKELMLVWTKFIGGNISYHNKTIYFVLITIITIPFMFSLIQAIRKRNSKTMLFWVWLVIPISFGFFISIFTPAFKYFRFLYVLPAFYAITVYGVNSLKEYKSILVTILLFVNLFGWCLYAFDDNQHRENWASASGFVDGKINGNEIIVFNYYRIPAGYRWYGNGDALAIDGKNQDVTMSLNDKSGLYYFDYLSDVTDPDKKLLIELQKLGYAEKQVYNFRGVGQIRYFSK